MLKAAQIKKLKDLGIDTKKLFEAVKAEEEVDFEMPEINNLTDEQLAERDKHVIAIEKPKSFGEGKAAGIKIANKILVKKFNLTDVDVDADVEKTVAILENSLAKGDTGLKEQITLLQKDKERIELEKDNAIKSVEQASQDRELITYFPKNRADLLNDDEYLDTVKKNLKIEIVDGVKVVKKGDTILRDKTTQAPIQIKDAISTLFTERKWISGKEGNGGRGGNDDPGSGGTGGIKTYSKAIEQYVKDNPGANPMSPAASDYVSKIAKETTDFVYD